jgi:predicted esterase
VTQPKAIHTRHAPLRVGDLTSAKAALIMVHGRGASADDMLSLASAVVADWVNEGRIAIIAPQADGSVWYPQRFMMPRSTNEPYLTAALARLDALVSEAAAVLPLEKIALLGFSQGACLALEYAASHPRRYGAVFGLSGGLIGDQLPEYTGDMAETPVFLGCSDVDFHIPVERVHESADVFAALNARVEKRIYPGMGHTVNQDEVTIVRQWMKGIIG